MTAADSAKAAPSRSTSMANRWARDASTAWEPMVFSGDDKTDVAGTDLGSRVTDDYEPGDPTFNGRIEWVKIDLGEDAKYADHLIKPEELWHIAMARQ
jgi:hypothetical protein